uniref:Uncharacterized protein n=1 Tax=Leersia perrieri TaxID=77586 RepID=A0A0D9W2C8_9ORYZ
MWNPILLWNHTKHYSPAVIIIYCGNWSSSPSTVSKPNSVYKLDSSSSARRRLKRHACLKYTAYAAVRSWIVGAGAGGDTVFFFDTNTGNGIRGPNLESPKSCPVITSVGNKVYAFSRNPCWKRHHKSDPDFPPWFELLDLNGSKVVKFAATAAADDEEHDEELMDAHGGNCRSLLACHGISARYSSASSRPHLLCGHSLLHIGIVQS